MVEFQTSEQELKQFFAAYGAVKDSKIIADRAGVSKGYVIQSSPGNIALIIKPVMVWNLTPPPKVNFYLFIYKLKVVMCILKSDACGPENQEINFLGAF